MKEYNLEKKYNWETASEPVIKKYVADLLQSGTNAPVATVLYNNTDISFEYEYVTTGVYAVISSKPIFSNCTMGCPPQKTQVNITNSTYIDNIGTPNGYSITAFPVANNTIIILSTDLTAESDYILGNFNQTALEITIHN